MQISSDIVISKTLRPMYDGFKLRWNFGGNSSVISLSSDIDTAISTGHWMTDNSDLFGFDKHNQLSKFELSLPNMNCCINLSAKIDGYCQLNGSGKHLDVIPPMRYRYFDPVKKELFLFNNEINQGQLIFYALHSDFFLIVKDAQLVGYRLSNPINYFTNNKFGYVDQVNHPDKSEYEFFNLFFELMSDNNLEKCGDDMSVLISELKYKLENKLYLIKSDFRRRIFMTQLNQLIDYYC